MRYVSNQTVISEKIQCNNFLLKSKAFTASLALHAALISAAVYVGASHPIPLEPSEKSIMISLAEFSSANGDIRQIEQKPFKKKSINPISEPEPIVSKPQQYVPATTPPERPPLAAALSPEASAPLAASHTAHTEPPKSTIDYPSLTHIPVNEPPRNPVAGNEIGGAALGHIHAMIKDALTYPSIARKLRLEGVVLVSFILQPDGTVVTAQVKSTSGSKLLDTKAIQTILSLSGDYPALGKTFELSIPIAFDLTKS